MSMPDGELRLYCTRMSQVISYFADDGEGGSMLWLEPSELARVSQATLDEMRPWIIGHIAERLHCSPHEVEGYSIKDLCERLNWRPEPPRHPWQVKTRSPERDRKRPTR